MTDVNSNDVPFRSDEGKLAYATGKLKGREIQLMESIRELIEGGREPLRVLIEKVLDKECAIEIVTLNGCLLEYLCEGFKNNKNVVTAAVKNWCFSLQYASDELRGDKDFVLQMIKIDGCAIKGALDGLKENEEVLTAAVIQTELALLHCQTPANKELMVKVVKKMGEIKNPTVINNLDEDILEAAGQTSLA